MARILPFHRRRAAPDLPAAPPRAPATAPAAYPERDELLDLLCRLSPGARAALLLSHAGWTDTEIARLTNGTPVLVAGWLRTARQQMGRDWRAMGLCALTPLAAKGGA